MKITLIEKTISKNETSSRRFRKCTSEKEEGKGNRDISENIPEDSLVHVLAAIHIRISSTETIIVPEIQQTSGSSLSQTPSH